MAVINWSKEAANIADTSGLFGSLDSVLDTKNVLKNVLTEEGKAFVKEAFNKYRVVMWLTKDFEAKNVERFGETDIEGSTKLVTGQKVIRLAATESKQIPIIYWQDDHYEATQLPNDTYLVNLPYEDSTWANAKKVFLNDVKRIYKIIKDQENKLTEIGDVIENVEELLVWAENENIVDRDIVELKLKFEEALRVNKDDKEIGRAHV